MGCGSSTATQTGNEKSPQKIVVEKQKINDETPLAVYDMDNPNDGNDEASAKEAVMKNMIDATLVDGIENQSSNNNNNEDDDVNKSPIAIIKQNRQERKLSQQRSQTDGTIQATQPNTTTSVTIATNMAQVSHKYSKSFSPSDNNNNNYQSDIHDLPNATSIDNDINIDKPLFKPRRTLDLFNNENEIDSNSEVQSPNAVKQLYQNNLQQLHGFDIAKFRSANNNTNNNINNSVNNNNDNNNNIYNNIASVNDGYMNNNEMNTNQSNNIIESFDPNDLGNDMSSSISSSHSENENLSDIAASDKINIPKPTNLLNHRLSNQQFIDNFLVENENDDDNFDIKTQFHGLGDNDDNNIGLIPNQMALLTPPRDDKKYRLSNEEENLMNEILSNEFDL